MKVDRDTIFSVGGQFAKLVAMCDDSGAVIHSVESYDTKTQIMTRYALDERGEVIFDENEQPLMEAVAGKQLFFIVTIDPPRPGAEVYEPSESVATKE